jgi:hypothetical protein
LRGAVWVDREKRRKHANTRRTDVSKQSGYFFVSDFFFIIIFYCFII